MRSHVTELANKTFGNLNYDMELSEYDEDYCEITRDTSMRETELHE